MQHNYSGVSKVDMSEDIEPVLSKIDVVLTFAIEVRRHSFTTVTAMAEKNPQGFFSKKIGF